MTRKKNITVQYNTVYTFSLLFDTDKGKEIGELFYSFHFACCTVLLLFFVLLNLPRIVSSRIIRSERLSELRKPIFRFLPYRTDSLVIRTILKIIMKLATMM